MLYFEIKKVFSKFRNQAAVILLLAILAVTSILTINRVSYVDSEGNESSGIAAARALRAAQNEWAGCLTEDVFAEAVRLNDRINQSEKARSDEIQKQNKVYAKKQGISDIANLICSAFSEWRKYDYYLIDKISPDGAKAVYSKRISSLTAYWASGDEHFSDAEKQFLTQRFECLETPFYYEYMSGWSALLQDISTFLLLLALIIGFLISGIFSDEFQLKADSVFFSSKLGRNRAVLAKIGAGFWIITVFYIIFVLLYSAIVLLALGADGAGCPIQLDLWRSAYNLKSV